MHGREPGSPGARGPHGRESWTVSDLPYSRRYRLPGDDNNFPPDSTPVIVLGVLMDYNFFAHRWEISYFYYSKFTNTCKSLKTSGGGGGGGGIILNVT